MPTTEMRGRYLMREYWRDRELFTALTAEQREVYIGLWMFADDSGWLRWEPEVIAASLFMYEDAVAREARVTATLDVLVRLKKARKYACGHVCLPSVAQYPRAGRRASATLEEHQTESKRNRGSRSVQLSSPYPTLPEPEPYPTLTLPQSPRPRARRGAAGLSPIDNGTFSAKVAAAGGYVPPKKS